MSNAVGGQRRSARRQRTAVPVIAVLLAALAGGVLLWTVKGHQSSNPAIPVAIVNLDQPVTTGTDPNTKTVAAGRQLAANLSQPATATQTPLSWQLMDADDADAGLRDGTVYGVLTIPAAFSAGITSTSGTTPQQAQLQLVTNDSASAAVAALAQLTVNQAAATMGDQATSSYVDQMLQSMTSIHNSLTSSATSAQTLATSSEQLASSSHTVADSSAQVASGATSVDQGATSLEQGATSLNQGATSLNQGATSLASGADSLASGASQAAAGAAQVAGGTDSLAAAAGTLAQGAQSAASGAAGMSAAAQKVATGASALASQSADLAAGLTKVDTATADLADRSASVASHAQDVAGACPPLAGPVYCQRVALLARETGLQSDAVRALQAATRVQVVRSTVVAKGSAGVSTAVSGLSSGLASLSSGMAQVSSGAAALSGAATQLSTGASGVAKGTASVATGAAQTSTGASSLASGAATLSSGAASLSSGAASLSSGAGSLASGSAQLASGTSQLAGGADQLASGNDQLASGLTSGAGQVPTYTDDQRTQLVTVVTTPVHVASSADNPTTVAASLVPVVLALTLWLGTLMMFLTGSSVPVGQAWSQATAGRRVLVGLLPAALVGVLQAAVVLVLVAVSGSPISSPLGLAALAVLGAVAFAAINQALVSVLGGVGRMVSLAFVAVQAAAFGGLVPIETAPAALQLLNGMLPLPQFVAATSRLLLGGGGTVVGACLVLVVWTALAVGAAVLATSRRRPQLAMALRPSSSPGTLDLSLAGDAN